MVDTQKTTDEAAKSAKKTTKSTTKSATKSTKTTKKSTARKKTLVIVESPSKGKIIGGYLGSSYKVVASVGHVRDLPKSRLAIDIENNFEPEYINIRGKGDKIKELKKEAANASRILLATDPDREGEAIAWHLAYLLGIDPDALCRVEFNEINKEAVKSAIKNPRAIEIGLVDAQQARRVLDRLVGYQISPLLWKKIRRGLSAGRVQSAALKILCDREREIMNFIPEEYWNIFVDYGEGFKAQLQKIDGKKASIKSGEQADSIEKDLNQGSYTVKDVNKGERKTKPYAPFTTSTMQQDASVKLGFQTRKTMQVAQQLYEGVSIKGMGARGLITYIRTDSVRVSDVAKSAAKSYITEKYGSNYTGNNVFSNKKKDIQDAHEAIRPSDVTLEPADIKDSLTPDQYKLYSLIWSRFVASQMAPSVADTVAVIIENGRYELRANGFHQKFDGWRKVYTTNSQDSEISIPELNSGDKLQSDAVIKEQKFTQPPARYTEASLVKELEDKNIGRPSTYATIITTIVARKYVKREKKSLVPTKLGFDVTDLLAEYFADIVDAKFTGEMEDNLDKVELKQSEWKNVVSDFYKGFSEELKIADAEAARIEQEIEYTDEVCELCGKPMIIKEGRFGRFMACSGYPECQNTKPIVIKTGVMCPKCGKEILQKKSRRGRIFYGCSGYPDCDVSFWDKPVNKHCPVCNSLLVEAKSRNSKYKYKCSNSECNYKEGQEPEEGKKAE